MSLLRIVLVALVLGGCATAIPRAPVDVAGRWTGTWFGHGVAMIPRDEDVTLDLVQVGAAGHGRLLMAGTLASDSIPDTVRDSGMTGVRIAFEVSGDRIRVTHELGPRLFAADMVVFGDRMVGRVLDTPLPIRLELMRERTHAAEAPPTPAPAPPLPPVALAPPPRVDAAPTPEEPRSVPPEAARRDAPPPAEFRAIPELRTIHFDFDRSEIRPGDAALLDANAAWLRAHPEARVLIEGHCDERGTAEYNLILGERRARSAVAYLLGRGIADTRMTITSYGFERPLCTEHTEACWSRNRRAGFLVK